jgi:hypothetical protein
MADWSRDDVIFSLRRYLAETLGQPWVLRFERTEIRNEERPMGYLELGPGRTTRSRSTVPQGNVERAAAITINLYPKGGTDARAGRRVAEATAQLLQDVIDFGLDLGNDRNGRPKAGPYRIPLYNYKDVVGAGPSEPYDRLWMGEDFSVRTIQDPVDPRLYAVIGEGTLSWEAAGRTYGAADERGVVLDVPGTFSPTRPVGPPQLALSPARAEAGGRLTVSVP